MTPQLLQESEQFCLQFACQHCAYFEPKSRSCSEEYPNHEHLDARLIEPEVLFCKLFELK
ncbi:MAG TPA: hypothetical protein VN764_17635 [Polyangiaceae bacterium]|nr:hypothetical protein [Polyangiaceae bacterium]